MKKVISFLLIISMLMTFSTTNSNVVYAAGLVPESSLEIESETELASSMESSMETEVMSETEQISETESLSEIETIQESETTSESEIASETIQESETILETETISESEFYEDFLLEESEPDTEYYYGDVGFEQNDSSNQMHPRRSAGKNQNGTCRDTVLVLDASDSMRGEPNAVMKAAAVKFCKSVLAADGTNRVAIVVYNSNIVGRMNFSDDLNQMTNYINSIGASGLTNISAALVTAKNLLDMYSTSTATKNIVLLSDGYPVRGMRQNNGKYNYTGISQSYPYANAAYEYYVQDLKNDYNVYTLGFFHSITHASSLSYVQQFMTDIQNKGYYEVTNVDELEFTFGDVAEDIIKDDSNCPIVIVPGIMGSQLYENNGLVWADFGKIMDSSYHLDEHMAISKSMSIHNYDTESHNPINQALLNKGKREYGAIKIYEKLVDSIIDRFTDDDGNITRDVYFFSYDFRKSNMDSAQQLDQYINDILSCSKALYDNEYTQVDIVAHSMGGLVTAKYVETYSADKIHKVITAGTPYEGAPKLQNSVLTKEVLDNVLTDNILYYLGYLTKECKASFPSIAELAPTDAYYNGHTTKFEQYTGQKQGTIIKKKIYKTLNLSEYHDINSMIFNAATSTPYNDALVFHEDIKTDAGYNVLASLDNSYFSVGINQKTIAGLKFNDGTDLASLDVDALTYEQKGDGTVPYDSGTMMKHLNELSGDRVIKFETTHTGLVGGDKDEKDTDPITWICDILSTGKSSIESDEEQTKKYIVIRVACPVDVAVEKNGEALNSTQGQIHMETSYGVLDFVGNGDIKMLCIDDADDYQIQLNGTDRGTMDYTISYFDGDDKLVNEYEFFEVPITETTRIETGTDSDYIKLCVDEDADGTADYELYPEGYEPKTGMTKISDTCYQYTTDNMDILYEITAKYGNVYHINMTVKNKTNDTIHDWALEYDSTDKINNIWNGMLTDDNNKTVIKNAGYNQDIPAQGSVSFGYMANFNQDIQIPTYFKLLGETASLDEADCDIHYQVDADWGSGYNASIQLTNTTTNTIEDWGIEFDFPDTIENIWGAQIVSKTGNHYVLANQGYNQNIGTGQTVSIGFTVTAVGEKAEPENCRITHIEAK